MSDPEVLQASKLEKEFPIVGNGPTFYKLFFLHEGMTMNKT